MFITEIFFVIYYINTLLSDIKNISKYALVHPAVLHACALLAMLLHHTPLAEKFMDSCP
jgi:hypothetical protein